MKPTKVDIKQSYIMVRGTIDLPLKIRPDTDLLSRNPVMFGISL